MKNVKTLIAAAILSSMSFANFAAVEVQSTPEGQQKVGTISANAGTNLGSLEEQLAQKADEMGAKSFRITSVTGPNTLHGTACNQVNHLIPTRVLVKGGEITCKMLK
ncbi:putative outer membrane protein [Shigella sonnei]|nr:putative outer membrane protein [Shigella sonnei]SJH81732.1 putative outer membrane protein [Shigella sonnei]